MYTQIDLRHDANIIQRLSIKNEEPVTVLTAENLAEKIGAVKYIECSALTGEGIHNVFREAVRVVKYAKVS